MRILTITLAALALSGAAVALQKATAQATPVQASAPADAQIIAQQLPSYPLTVCPVSKEALEAMDTFNFVHEGRLVRFCCKDCVKEFKKDPATTLKMIDEGVIKAQKATYPMMKCPVSGHELAADAVDFVQGTRLVRFCCKDCVAGFQKEPAKYLAQIDAALIAEQKKTYPLTTCLVSGKAIEGQGVDHLYGTRLTRFCCPKCPEAFEKDPAKYLAQLDAAAKKPAPEKKK